MEKKKVFVPNISCGHCVNTIETELGQLDGVSEVVANKETKEVLVSWDAPADWDLVEATLIDVGFPPQASS